MKGVYRKEQAKKFHKNEETKNKAGNALLFTFHFIQKSVKNNSTKTWKFPRDEKMTVSTLNRCCPIEALQPLLKDLSEKFFCFCWDICSKSIINPVCNHNNNKIYKTFTYSLKILEPKLSRRGKSEGKR